MKHTKFHVAGITGILLFSAMLAIMGTASGNGGNGGEPGGVTPGYWKNHLETWEDTGFDPSDLVGDYFNAPGDSASATLLEALNFKGGKGTEGAVRILLRQAVAGLLNQAFLDNDPDMTYPMDDLIYEVNNALNSGDRTTMLTLKDQLDSYNNLGIPYL